MAVCPQIDKNYEVQWGQVLVSLWSIVWLRKCFLHNSLPNDTVRFDDISAFANAKTCPAPVWPYTHSWCLFNARTGCCFLTCISSLLVNQAQIFTRVVVKLKKLFCNNRSLNLSYFWLLRSPKMTFSRYVSNELMENQIHARRNALIDCILMAQSLINPEIRTGKWMKLFLEKNIALLQISSMLLEELLKRKH